MARACARTGGERRRREEKGRKGAGRERTDAQHSGAIAAAPSPLDLPTPQTARGGFGAGRFVKRASPHEGKHRRIASVALIHVCVCVCCAPDPESAPTYPTPHTFAASRLCGFSVRLTARASPPMSVPQAAGGMGIPSTSMQQQQSQSSAQMAANNAAAMQGQAAAASSSSSSSSSGKPELRVGGRYRLGRKIGSGSFGDIYLGANINTGEEVAVKLESIKSRHPQLAYEYRLYRILQNKNGTVPGIPAVKWFGREGDFNVLVMELLGPSLEEMFNCQSRARLDTQRVRG